MGNPRVEGYRSQYRMVHEWLQGTVEGMSNEQANFQPEGKAMSAGAHYAHHVQSEDAIFHGMFQGKEPLLAGEYAGKTGTETPAPQGDWSEWARTTGVDVESARAYADAVFEATDGYLAGLSDSDLDGDLDMSAFGQGMKPLSYMIDIMLLNAAVHTGEISTAKGLQGLKGYPF